MSQLQYYTNIICFINESLADECSACNVVENKDGTLITITSNIPEKGPEFDFKIDEEVSLDILYCLKIKKFKTTLLEKKISKSINKYAYQLLTFKVKEDPTELELPKYVYDKKCSIPFGKGFILFDNHQLRFEKNSVTIPVQESPRGGILYIDKDSNLTYKKP